MKWLAFIGIILVVGAASIVIDVGYLTVIRFLFGI